MKLFIDFETASELSLRTAGKKNYMTHPSTRITHTSVLVDDASMPVWYIPDIPEGSEVVVIAHNVPFERQLINRFHPEFAKKVTKWVCTATMARLLRSPGDLKGATKYFGAANKDESGAALMRKVCKLEAEEPKKKSGTVLKIPFEWKHEDGYWRRTGKEVDELMQAYCDQDVLACRTLYQKMLKHDDELGPKSMRDVNKTAEEMTDEANARGMRVDIDKLETMLKATELLEKAANDYCTKHLGGFRASQVTAIRNYCNEQGLPIKGTGAPDVARILITDHGKHPLVKHLQHRNRLVKSSLKKLPKLKEQLHDNRLYDTLIFSGASATGRWSGRGFQPQNLPRPVGKLDSTLDFIAKLRDKDTAISPEEADRLAGAIRTLLLPDDGEVVGTADLSQIELRLSTYHAKHELYNQMLKDGGDVYLDFAKKLYKNDALTKDSPERALCKIAVLSLQYGCGVRKFRDNLLTGDGTNIPEAEADRIVKTFRALNPGLTEQWNKHRRDLMVYSIQGKDYRKKLFSGRVLNYGPITKRDVRYADGNVDKAYTYWNGMYYKTVWGATIYQNQIQAEARDIFTIKLAAMRPYKEYKLMTTVHDEAVFSIPKDDTKFEERWNKAGAELIAKMWPGLYLESDTGRLPCYYK